ncbi:IclR family transcriptional regulator [Mesorhizobium sp. UC22_110]|uniref:IclR family transcriptional regulator n=1 Tax=unclassified Mesorhizobium TaxID=325217 RepID=UPI00366CDDF6
MKTTGKAGNQAATKSAGAKGGDETTDGSEDALRGMARSFAVLELLASSPGRVVDVTRQLNLPWATVHRTIVQLEQARFLRRDPASNRYEIGPRMWFLGSAYLANHRVLRTAMPYLARLEGEEGIAMQIVERIGYQSVAIYSHQRVDEDITKAHYGYHFPLHCGSKGQVLLAHESPSFIDEYLGRDLERLTPDTITDPAQLRDILETIRHDGFSLTVADVQPFTGSLAAPIRDADGTVISTLCFVFRKALAKNTARREDLTDKLLQASQSISIDLGWRPGQ